MKKKKIPNEVKPYLEYVSDHGGNDPEELLARLDEKNLAFTNIIVFTLAMQVDAQVRLLQRLLDAGLLKEGSKS